MKRITLALMLVLLLLACGQVEPHAKNKELKIVPVAQHDNFDGVTLILSIDEMFTFTLLAFDETTRIDSDSPGIIELADYSETNEKAFTIKAVAPGETSLAFSKEKEKVSIKVVVKAMSINSSGIKDGKIDLAYGKFGSQLSKGVPTLSLPIEIENPPFTTVSFALSIIDPDGGNWVHWLATDFSADVLVENASIKNAAIMVQGKNDFGTKGYGGPTPPDKTHKYVITLYALNETLNLQENFSYKQFQEALKGKVLATAELTGTYTNKR